MFSKKDKLARDIGRLKKIKESDRGTISELYLECKSLIHLFRPRLSNYPHIDIETLYNDAFTICCKKIQSGALSSLTSELKGYIYGVMSILVKHEIKEKYHLQKENMVDIADLHDMKLPDDFDMFDDIEKIRAVYEVISSLEEPCKSIIYLYYYKEISYKDMIGKVPGYSTANSIKVKSHYCKKTMEDLLRKKLLAIGYFIRKGKL